jgi:hypothetical protein
MQHLTRCIHHFATLRVKKLSVTFWCVKIVEGFSWRRGVDKERVHLCVEKAATGKGTLVRK